MRIAVFLQLVELTMAWTHFGMATMAQGHEAAQASLLRQTHHKLTSLVRGVLFGEMTPAEVHAAALAHGIDTGQPHHAIRAELTGEVELAEVEHYFRSRSRLESTARTLHVHVNTVKYRLACFEELTEATLRDPEVLLEAWWAVQRGRLS